MKRGRVFLAIAATAFLSQAPCSAGSESGPKHFQKLSSDVFRVMLGHLSNWDKANALLTYDNTIIVLEELYELIDRAPTMSKARASMRKI